MGCSSSSPEAKLSSELAKQNKNDYAQKKSIFKILLLGAGESGKSALFKQIKAIHGVADDSVHWKQVIQSNIIEFIQVLIQAANEAGEAVGPDGDQVLQLTHSSSLATNIDSRSVGQVIAELWQSPAIQSTFQRRSQLQLNEAHVKFLDRVLEISKTNYVPSPEDIVLARVRTTGVHAQDLMIAGKQFSLYDVGGQRNERRKWIHVFDDVHAIIFVVGLSDYDLNCFEDSRKNRMVDALELFDSIANNTLFRETPIILFLNKSDLFAQKVETHPIAAVPHFADFAAGPDYRAGCLYFEEKFLHVAGKQGATDRKVYSKFTNATDKTNVATMFAAARDIVLMQNLKQSGLG